MFRTSYHCTDPTRTECYQEFKDIPSEDDLSVYSNTNVKKAVFQTQTGKISKFRKFLTGVIHILPIFSVLGLAATFFLPINYFKRGMLTTVFLIGILMSLRDLIIYIIGKIYIDGHPEQGKFEIPDYSQATPFEIPVVELNANTKSYEGWMCEINDYDPELFQVSMLRPVYVKLEGTILTISTTLARIPKRAVWNEAVDQKNIVFLNHRTYNILGCHVSLLPLDIPRKKYFSRKFPIQLLIKCPINNTESGVMFQNSEFEDVNQSQSVSNFSNNFSEINAEYRNSKDLHRISVTFDSDSNIVEDKRPQKESLTKQFSFINYKTPETKPQKSNNNAKHVQTSYPSELNKNIDCEEDIRLFLFGRSGRQKEDWFRRFVDASIGLVYDHDLCFPNFKYVPENDIRMQVDENLEVPNKKFTNIIKKINSKLTLSNSKARLQDKESAFSIISTKSENQSDTLSKMDSEVYLENNYNELENETEENNEPDFEGMIMSSCVARNKEDYIKFMILYQKACSQTNIPIYKHLNKAKKQRPLTRRMKRKSIDLWRGIDISLFLGSSGSIVWFNVLLGRFIYSILTDSKSLAKVQDIFQKKLSAMKLPTFMDDVIITNINLGTIPPIIHRISQPLLDEQGIWVDADVTYEGLAHITISTKLNLLRLRARPKPPTFIETHEEPVQRVPIQVYPQNMATSFTTLDGDEFADVHSSSSEIFDIDSGSSESSESDINSKIESNTNISQTSTISGAASDSAPRTLRFVDRITELSYVQRAMQNMSSNITLKVELKGLVARATVNMPPPPSDRVWFGFRGPPRLWISAFPAFGDKSVDWTIVTKVIERKICELVNKLLVYPNLVDITIPMLGRNSYQET